ncbi:hypothetical protein SAMN06265218_103101 [Fodinibius sediminis]|uniref:Uncharacterized protein n=1 Tax=Fodinibius sediminis TaxID=1214077 RepID=A0A521BGV2_9BACT|nr:hypothetical protein SAMN06265218_103101 [Fodinibius sediminis]
MSLKVYSLPNRLPPLLQGSDERITVNLTVTGGSGWIFFNQTNNINSSL